MTPWRVLHSYKIAIVSVKSPAKLEATDNEYPVLYLLGFIKYLAEKAFGPHTVSVEVRSFLC